jgi:hypothetical protein
METQLVDNNSNGENGINTQGGIASGEWNLRGNTLCGVEPFWTLRNKTIAWIGSAPSPQHIFFRALMHMAQRGTTEL